MVDPLGPAHVPDDMAVEFSSGEEDEGILVLLRENISRITLGNGLDDWISRAGIDRIQARGILPFDNSPGAIFPWSTSIQFEKAGFGIDQDRRPLESWNGNLVTPDAPHNLEMDAIAAFQKADFVSSQASWGIGGAHPAGHPESSLPISNHRGRPCPPFRLLFVRLENDDSLTQAGKQASIRIPCGRVCSRPVLKFFHGSGS